MNGELEIKPGVKLDKKYNGHLTPEKKLVTCLLIICKFLPGIIGEMLNQHVETKGLLVDEHKGSRKETRGKSVCVDHLFAAGFTLFDKDECIIQQGLVYG